MNRQAKIFERGAARRALLSLLLMMTLPAQAAFTNHGDGTISDTATGLMWDQCSWGQSGSSCSGTASTHNWQQALQQAVAANALNYKGYNDWRLPNKNELESLVDLGRSGPAIDVSTFPNTPGNDYWSSTPYALDPALAWYVSFSSGNTFAFVRNSGDHVRLVRAGTVNLNFGPLAAFDTRVAATQALTLVSTSANGAALAATLAAEPAGAASGYWLLLPTGSAPPTPGQLENPATYLPPNAVAASANGTLNFNVSNLAPGSYTAYFAARANNNMNLIQQLTFTLLQAIPALASPALAVLALLLGGVVWSVRRRWQRGNVSQ